MNRDFLSRTVFLLLSLEMTLKQVAPPSPVRFAPCARHYPLHHHHHHHHNHRHHHHHHLPDMATQLYDYDRFGADELIGQTVIDLEDRWFSQEWHELERQDPLASERRETLGPYKPLEVRDLNVPTSSSPQGQVNGSTPHRRCWQWWWIRGGGWCCACCCYCCCGFVVVGVVLVVVVVLFLMLLKLLSSFVVSVHH